MLAYIRLHFRMDFYSPVSITSYDSSHLLLQFLLELITVGPDLRIQLIITTISPNSLQAFQIALPEFSFMRRDEKSLEALLHSFSKASFPKSGTQGRTAIEETIRAKPNLIDGMLFPLY